MNNDELDDFSLEGGDELLNSEECPHCGLEQSEGEVIFPIGLLRRCAPRNGFWNNGITSRELMLI